MTYSIVNTKRPTKICIGLVIMASIVVFLVDFRYSKHSQFGQPKLRHTASPSSCQERVKNSCGVRNVYAERLAHANSICKHINVSKSEDYLKEFYYSKKTNLFLCKVPKVGSTSWTIIFEALHNGIEGVRDLNQQRRGNIQDRGKSAPYKNSIRRKYINKTYSVIMARDPYARLFSAYIDKQFVPAMYTVDQKRPLILEYCKNVTFQQFLDFNIHRFKKSESLDPHISPVIYNCQPCLLKPKAILKLETFTEDVIHVLSSVGIEKETRDAILNSIHGKNVTATLMGLIKQIFHKNNKHKLQCTTWKDIVQKLWKSFQIQGYIDENYPLPTIRFTSPDLYHREDYVIKIVLETISQFPVSRDKSLIQRRKALLQAYSTLRLDTIRDIQIMYELDFEIFSYSKFPPTDILFSPND